ncbi:helical backbone metal receptor [Proteiniborus sp. MB09-C3]|uniref:helical backbone metal receptor n=1 Tax=Proteiniborus sp. MB09-C3 TaxID=3050072 RepID=UPI0025548EDB|nr:helical backbone metal receptor [Proteiniborus sp. MB09-C3]WIV11817.1 helical backbone metal receptor [Proteiniborus sp. MB09-C3]
MKNISRLLLISILITALFSGLAFASTSLKFDGSTKVLTTELKDGRTFVAGSSLKSLGLDFTLNQSTAIVKNKEVELRFTLNTNKVKVNNTDFTLDSKSYKNGQEVYLPLRFILETLGYDVKWDKGTNGIRADKQKNISYPVTIESNEIKYTVAKEPSTIVSLAPDVTETLFAIGAGDKVKGRTQYCNYPKAVSAIKEVGSMYEPNVEVVIDINPDLVIAATHYKEEILNKFKEGKLSVLAKESPKTLEEMYDYTLKIGAVVNKNYEARALVSTMKSKVETVKMYTGNVKNKPKAYYVVGTGQYGEYTAGKDTFISEIIRVAGGINVADDVTGWSYSLEKLIDNDPDIIFGPDSDYETMTTSDNYKGLKAIKNNNYKIVDRDVFSRPSPRLIDEGLKVLVEMFNKNIVNKLSF